MGLYHLRFSAQGRLSLARDEAERRSLVRSLVRVAGRRLVLFSLADDHQHVVSDTDRPRVLGDSVRRVLRAHRPDLVFDPPYVKPITTRDHLESLVGYLLTQTDHHALGEHPALWSGSCFLDLLGVRLLPGFSNLPFRAQLPRIHQRELLQLVGLPPVPVEPATAAALARAGAVRIVELAAAVHGVVPSFDDHTTIAVLARKLAVHVGLGAGLATDSLARALGCSIRTVQHLSHGEVDARPVLALHRRLSLEQLVADAALQREARALFEQRSRWRRLR